MPEHTGASNAEAAPALEQGEKFPAIMSSSSLVPSAGSLLMWLLLSAECKEGFCVGIVLGSPVPFVRRVLLLESG